MSTDTPATTAERDDILRLAKKCGSHTGNGSHVGFTQEAWAKFCAALSAPAAQPADSAMEVLRELVEAEQKMNGPTIKSQEEWEVARDLYRAAWDRARALVAKETPHAAEDK